MFTETKPCLSDTYFFPVCTGCIFGDKRRKTASVSFMQVKLFLLSYHFFSFLSHRGNIEDIVQDSIDIRPNLRGTNLHTNMLLINGSVSVGSLTGVDRCLKNLAVLMSEEISKNLQHVLGVLCTLPFTWITQVSVCSEHNLTPFHTHTPCLYLLSSDTGS